MKAMSISMLWGGAVVLLIAAIIIIFGLCHHKTTNDKGKLKQKEGETLTDEVILGEIRFPNN